MIWVLWAWLIIAILNVPSSFGQIGKRRKASQMATNALISALMAVTVAVLIAERS